VRVGSEEEYVAAEATGPIKAFLKAIKHALSLSGDTGIAAYGSRLTAVSLRVRSINQKDEDLRVRAALTLSDGKREWTCLGISQDLLQACWKALVDAVEYGMATR
jgi:2-isopropylmalate synthase